MGHWIGHIWIALALDYLIGDPRWLPHPVRLMGRTAQRLEGPMRSVLHHEHLAGILTAAVIIVGTGATTWAILFTAQQLSFGLSDILAVGILYSTFAAKDLSVHSRAVLKAIEAKDLPRARKAVSFMVGRDTETLDEEGITRATVESVAENTVDGVLSPLFYAFLFGPIGAMLYKSINTLDSTFGYRNARYIRFGWASARIDDLANYIPARLSLLFVSIGSWLLGEKAAMAFRIGLRDARKHHSPNAGYPEAAFAGALGVRLGGPVFRNGVPDAAPFLGDAVCPLDQTDIRKANRLMVATTLIAALILSGAGLLWEASL